MASVQQQRPSHMTVDEFIAWPGDGEGGKYQLVDGELRAMSPASTTHRTIQANTAGIMRDHLRLAGGRCRVLTEPAVAVRVKAKTNMRVPDVGVTCSLDMAGQIALPDPIVLIEIISPGNRKDTWDNVWAYATIPTVAEIVVLQSSRIEAQLFRRDAAGAWPADAAIITSDEMLVLSTIGFNVPLSDFYAQTYLNVS